MQKLSLVKKTWLEFSSQKHNWFSFLGQHAFSLYEMDSKHCFQEKNSRKCQSPKAELAGWEVPSLKMSNGTCVGIWTKNVVHMLGKDTGRYETHNWLSPTQSVVGQEHYGEIWYRVTGLGRTTWMELTGLKTLPCWMNGCTISVFKLISPQLKKMSKGPKIRFFCSNRNFIMDFTTMLTAKWAILSPMHGKGTLGRT